LEPETGVEHIPLCAINQTQKIPFLGKCRIVCTIFDICFEHYSDIFTKSEYIRQKILIPYSAKKSDALTKLEDDNGEDYSVL
jgi:hypothetical protein